VLVRTRVDGQIDKIAFKEGQIVNQGDLLVEIDPRPYQATLDQAKAKKAQDEANLANANLDLQRFTKLGEFATKQQLDTQRSTVQQLTAQIAADDAAISNAQTQLDYTPSSRRSRASPACARSTSAISSTPRPRPAS
jgi:multidrug efflux system membrane fusion protein